MSKVRVAVLRGGPSREYDVSLKTGNTVLQNLSEEKYIPLDIFIDKRGIWHARGLPKTPGDILESVDVVFNALHGEYGEDGTVQKVLERYSVPYVGSGVSASALTMNKELTKHALMPFEDELGVRFAQHHVLYDGPDLEQGLRQIFENFTHPIVVKPLIGGSSVGVSVVHEYDELKKAAHEACETAAGVFFEEYIAGKEATCGVIDRFHNEPVYALLPVEIRPAKGHTFFDYDAKYNGASEEICPGNFSVAEKKKLQQLARDIHRALGLRHYSRADFIVTPEGIYFLEVNTLPGLTEASLVPKALAAVGCSLPSFLDHVVSIALERV